MSKLESSSPDCLPKVETWLSDVDVDGDGQLSYAEFKMSLAGNLLIDI